MAREPPESARHLVLGDELPLLRRLLVPLGVLLWAAAAVAYLIGTLALTPAIVIALLGAGCGLWSRTFRTERYEFLPEARRVAIEQRHGSAITVRSLPFEVVTDVVLTVFEGARRLDNEGLRQTPSYLLHLEAGAELLPLSARYATSLTECEATAARIHHALCRGRPVGSLLERSYAAALRRRDRLQAIWIARLMAPQQSLRDTERRVQADLRSRNESGT